MFTVPFLRGQTVFFGSPLATSATRTSLPGTVPFRIFFTFRSDSFEMKGRKDLLVAR